MRTLPTAARCGARGVDRRSRVLLALVLLLALVAPGIVTAGPAAADIDPGTVVVARKEGTVVALLSNGTTTELASGLGQIQSLAVLADGTMLTTDFAGNRLMGFGGRLGKTPVQVAAVNAPSGVSVGSDGSVYLTALDGILYRVDVDGRAVVPFASGLTLPGAPAEQNGTIYVPQGLLGVASVSSVDGAVQVLDAAVGQPGAAAAGKATPLLLSDTQGNRIYKYDSSTKQSETFAELVSPGPIAIDPTPRKGQAWSLLIGTSNAVVRIDAKGSVQERIEVSGTITGVGQATVAIPTDDGGATSPTSVVKEGEESSGGGFPVVLLLVVLLAAGLIAGVVVLVKRSSKRESDADWFQNPPAPPDPPRSGPGGSGGKGAPGGLDHDTEPERSPDEEQLIEIRRDLAELTQTAANVARQASTLREMVSRALEARTTARINREKEALRGASTDIAPLTSDMLELSTDEGRALFDAHQAGEIDSATLRLRWTDLGESDALEQVFRYGEELDRADLSSPSPEERHAAREAFDARQELIAVEAEQTRVTAEIHRLRGLEAELNRRVHGVPGSTSRPGLAAPPPLPAPPTLPAPPDSPGPQGMQEF